MESKNHASHAIETIKDMKVVKAGWCNKVTIELMKKLDTAATKELTKICL